MVTVGNGSLTTVAPGGTVDRAFEYDQSLEDGVPAASIINVLQRTIAKQICYQRLLHQPSHYADVAL